MGETTLERTRKLQSLVVNTLLARNHAARNLAAVCHEHLPQRRHGAEPLLSIEL